MKIKNFLEPIKIIKYSSALFWLASVINKIIFYLISIVTIVLIPWFIKILITGVSFDTESSFKLAQMELYIYQHPLFGLGVIISCIVSAWETGLISKFFKYLNDALKNIYYFKESYSDEFGLSNFLRDLIIILRKIISLKILGQLLFISAYVAYSEALEIFQNKNSNTGNGDYFWIRDIGDFINMNFVTALMLYILLNVLKVMYEQKNELHIKSKKLERESSLVI